LQLVDELFPHYNKSLVLTFRLPNPDEDVARMFPNKSTSASVGPRICPKCGHVADGETAGSICPDCGATTYPQGYCPVCEDYLRLPVGALCAKHDLVLEAGEPDSMNPTAPPRPISWVTVGVLPDSLAAAAPRIRLEAEGIPTFLEGERMGSPGMYRQATGGVKLQVPSDLAAEARIILSQSWSLPSDEKADFEDLL
jgi:hypothetical protein